MLQKKCSPKSQYNCQKQKLKCTQYCHSSVYDCSNIYTSKEWKQIMIVDKRVNSFNYDSSSLLFCDWYDDFLSPKTPGHSLFLFLVKRRSKQQTLVFISDVHLSIQYCICVPGVKRSCANINSNQKPNKIHSEIQTEAHSEVIEAPSLEKNQTTVF